MGRRPIARAGHARQAALFSATLLLVAMVLPELAGGEGASREDILPSALVEEVSLSAVEEAWVRAHPTVRVHFEAWPPFLLEQDGRPAGISADYLELICGRVGLEIEWVEATWVEALADVESRRGIDVLPILSRTPERERFLAYTRPYVSFPIVIFSRRDSFFVGGLDDLRGKRTVVERQYSMHGRLERDIGAESLLLVNTTEEALEAVALGRADGYVGNLAVGSYTIQRRGLTNVKVAAPAPYGPHDQAIGVRGDWPELARILDKSLATITPRGHDEIRQRHLAVRYEHGIQSSDVARWLAMMGAVAGALVLVFLIWNRRLRRLIRQRLRAEEALDRSRRQLIEAQRLARIGSWSYAPATEELVWSEETARIFGRDPAGPAPTLAELRDLFQPEDIPAFDAVVTDATEGREPAPAELRILSPGSVERHVICRAAPARMTEGDAESPLIGTFQDVTDRKEMELVRRRLELEVQRSEKLESLAVLAGGVAHDFNNILAAVMGNAELAALSTDNEEELREYLAEIVKASKRAAGLCRQMLAYSGRSSLALASVDLSALVAEVAEPLVADAEGISVRLDLDGELPRTRVDAAQIRQLVTEIVTNSVEALGSAGGEIVLSTRTVAPDEHGEHDFSEGTVPPSQGCIEISVRDDGPGMDESVSQKIFEPFFSTKFAGRGLGLAAVHGIARAHQGAVTVRSFPGRGTTVVVHLPCSKTTTSLPPKARSIPPSEQSSVTTVLLVDDEAQIRRVGELMLQTAGLQVSTACDGVEALELLESRGGEIGCVVLDLTMPRLDGREALAEIRSIAPDIPVIVSSGYHEADVRRRLGGLGDAVVFLQKPYDFEHLILSVKKVMKRSPRPSTEAEADRSSSPDR